MNKKLWLKIKYWLWDNAEWAPIKPLLGFLLIYVGMFFLIVFKFRNMIWHHFVGQYVDSMLVAKIIFYNLPISAALAFLLILTSLAVRLYSGKITSRYHKFMKAFYFLFSYMIVSNLILIFVLRASIGLPIWIF